MESHIYLEGWVTT